MYSPRLNKKVMQLAALRVEKLQRVAEGKLSYHMCCVCSCDMTDLLNLLSSRKIPDRQQPRSGQEDSPFFRKKHCAGKKKKVTLTIRAHIVTNTG